jgi:hypothetical protein
VQINTRGGARFVVLVALIGLMAGWLACGTDSSNEASSAGAGAGGDVGNGNGGEGAGTVVACVEASSCDGNGACSVDNGCCTCTLSCVNGAWSDPVCPDCAEPACPADPPEPGSPCSYCGVPLDVACGWEDCDDTGVTTATCTFDDTDGTYTWGGSQVACDPAPPCGPDPNDAPCGSDELCVIAEEVAEPTSTIVYACVTNPCTPDPTTCECAGSLCGLTNAPTCAGATARTLSCTSASR